MLKIFNFKTENFTWATFLVGLSTALSSVLGLVRDRLLASKLGAGPSMDIYFAAFRIPDLIYYIVIAGGLQAVFLPLFSQAAQKDRSFQFANNILNFFLVILLGICLLTFLTAPYLIEIVTPGFPPALKNKTSTLTRILLLNPIIFGISAVFSGMLQYFQKFFAYCLAPLLYNIGLILGILVLFPILGLKGLAVGAVLGALAHLTIQAFPAFVSDFSYRPYFNLSSSFLKEGIKLSLPGAAIQALSQFNLLAITALASTLISGSIGVFNLANNIRSFPIGMVGVSFAVTSFPLFSKTLANNERKRFLSDFENSLNQALFLIIPISVLLLILRIHIVRLILGTGQFGWWGTRLTAASLGIFAVALPLVSLIPVLLRAFFAFQDLKTPLIAGAVSVVLNLGLALFLIKIGLNYDPFLTIFKEILKLKNITHFKIVALPISWSIAQISQAGLLLKRFRQKFPDLNWKAILQSQKKTLLGTVALFLFSYSGLRLGALFLNTRTVLGLLAQALLAGSLGIFGFLIVVLKLKSKPAQIVVDSLRGLT